MKRLAIVAVAALAGCASNPVPTVTAVPVPVQCPAPVLPPKERLPIENLKPGASCEDAIAAYAESLNIAIARGRALERTLKGYARD